MRILFVVSRFPYPPIQGDRVRGYNQIRILSRKNRVVLVTPLPSKNFKDSLNDLRPFCEHIEVVNTPSFKRFLRMWRTPFNDLPLQTLYLFDPKVRKKVKFLLKNQSFDIIHVQLIRSAPVVEVHRDIPKVIDLIDSLSLNMSRRAQKEIWPLSWIASFEARRVQQYERFLTQKYDRLIVSSQIDREFIGDYKNLHVIPNGVDIDFYPYSEDDRETDMIVFTGRMGYFPNADAAVWFVNRVFPIINNKKPNTKFFIIGADPPRKVRELEKQENVFVTGYVPDLRDFLKRATIAVAPMQSGSGMQFKVLEAMACGAPVVASQYAIGGIKAVEGEHLLVANNEKEFAEKAVHLLNNADLRRQLTRNARNLVEKEYTWERSVEMLEDVYRLIISK